ncbi:MAG: nucleotidyltransferase [Chloroflexota bacterium]|nr:nucleotidyltransferase [Chloroflexota bacterium]
MADHLIPSTAVARYTAAPSPTTVSAAKSLQENIRSVLGADYETFLQGSYKNDTGIPDLNDVDIVAIRKQTRSAVFTPGIGSTNPISWERIFAEVQGRLEASHHYRGKTEIGDKCIKVHTNFEADVVPAVQIGDDYRTDPIAIYSFREGRERKNFPRVHAARNTQKHQVTNETYKPTVRMFKRWVRNWFPDPNIAPSFYVECLIHAVPNERFHSDMAWTFFTVGYWIESNITTSSVVMSVAGDKDILVPGEWRPERYEVFRAQLARSTTHALRALEATTVTDALNSWKRAFNE